MRDLTGSHLPISPVCSHPSLSIASAVFSGSLRYPRNTFFPLTQTWNEIPKLWEVLITHWFMIYKMVFHYLSFTVGCEVIHFLNVNQFDNITWNRNSNMPWNQSYEIEISAQECLMNFFFKISHRNPPVFQSPGMVKEQAAVHSVWPYASNIWKQARNKGVRTGSLWHQINTHIHPSLTVPMFGTCKVKHNCIIFSFITIENSS